MLDKWFFEDIREVHKERNIFVIIDENLKSDFLLELIKKDKKYKICEVHNDIDDLKAKYEIEKNQKNNKVIIFSTIALDRLAFIREYCETNASFRIIQLHRYIKQKIYEKLGIDVNWEAEKLIAIGKSSLGESKDFWDRVIKTGDIFSINNILDFLDTPVKIFKGFSKEEKNLFIGFLSQHMPYPLEKKPPQTIADEIAHAVFNNIAYKKEQHYFNKLYKVWANSKKHESGLRNYLNKYKIQDDIDIWDIPIDHPFSDVDRKWLEQIVIKFEDKDWLTLKLPIIKKRFQETINDLLNIGFWPAVYNLFSYDISEIGTIHGLTYAAEHYNEKFYKIDNAIRHIYTRFLAETKILKPFQEYYEKILQLYLNKWFKYFSEQYSENQTGLLKAIICENEPPIAIIVGDAISFEVSQEIVQGMGADFKIHNDFIYGNFPSETENNMSSLFVSSGELYSSIELREKTLLEETGNKIIFSNLDDLSVAHDLSDYSIFYSRDVDSMSEKQKLGALKYYDEFIRNVREKIEILIGCGYKKVFLVSDHGFVLTGILEEADKIQIDVKSEEKHVRYCATKEKLTSNPKNVISMPKKYKEYNNLYFSKTLNPFKTKGAYGFSHGGITPQELIVPFLTFEKIPEHENKLEITIENKEKLKSIVGDLYQIRIMGGSQTGDIFSSQRKIIITFVKDKKQFKQSDIIQIEAEKTIEREFAFEQHDDFEIIVVDAESKIRLDSCDVIRQKVRDLGGLGGK